MLWDFLAKLIAGPIVTGVIDGYKAKLAAGNTAERIAADLAAKELAVEQRERELNTQIVIAEEGRWWTALPRAIVQYAFTGFIVKCIVYDNMLGLGTTDPLGGDIQQAFLWCMALWFGGRTVEKVARIIKR